MILRLIIAIVVFYLVYRLARMAFLTGKKAVNPISREQRENLAAGEDLVEDPYCHTYIPISNAHAWRHDGKILYFCSRGCMESYQNMSQGDKKREGA
ncbi:MAG: hypothetical protein QM278_12250 [Pseudomonadota bacterium]|nr:hypothetical protein [Pseudomonadota bacterium]